MSELSNNREKRVKGLLELFDNILEKKDVLIKIDENKKLIDKMIPSDVIFLVDKLVKLNTPTDELKTGINKFLNIVYRVIANYTEENNIHSEFIKTIFKNNSILKDKLKNFQPFIKKLNDNPKDKNLLKIALEKLKNILKYEQTYIIKENIIFPILEREWKESGCVKIMWSFHDDIRKSLKDTVNMIERGEFSIEDFNKYIGGFYFNVNAILFRDERILFPYIESTIPSAILDKLFQEAVKTGFPYYTPEVEIIEENNIDTDREINLNTGILSVEQIILMFNHLPVDITFVDENNKVKYFSTPKKRIFPRTKSIIGREVNNCHPPESVHIVEKIVKSFREGSKDKADFWLNIGSEKILIQYFAIRDEKNNYRGVIEVSQEISEIQSLEGEKRLLSWD